MPLVNLGGFSNIGGKTIASSGISSSLNSSQLIESLVSVREIPIEDIQSEISTNNNKISAYQQLDDLLTTFLNASDSLRNTPIGDGNSDAFQARTTTITSNSSVAGSTYVSATATAGAQTTNYNISNIVLAGAESQNATGFTSQTASVTTAAATAGMFMAGTFQINGTNITLATGDSLQTIAAKINAVSSTTNTTASIVQLSSTNYQFVLTSNQTGVANAYTISDPSGVLANIAWTNQAANDASFTFNNQAVTRSTNSFSDLVSGVTFTLNASSPAGTTINVAVNQDNNGIIAGVNSFISSYNDLKTFVAQQNQRDPSTGLYLSTSYLGGDSTVSNIMYQISAELHKMVNGLSSPFQQLSDIGISFYSIAASGTNPAVSDLMKLDNNTFLSDLTSNYTSVKNIFEMTFTSSNPNFTVGVRTNDITVTNFTIDINTSRPNIIVGNNSYQDIVRIYYAGCTDPRGYVNANYTAYSSGTGGTIEGIPTSQMLNPNITEGSVINGLEMTYSGTGVDTATINLTQGIADRVFNVLDGATDISDGNITTQIQSLQTQNLNNTNEIATLKEQLDSYRQSLIREYAQMEQSIAKTNSVLMMLDAQQAARNAMNG